MTVPFTPIVAAIRSYLSGASKRPASRRVRASLALPPRSLALADGPLPGKALRFFISSWVKGEAPFGNV